MDEVTRRTVRQDRRFLWLWLITATACSVAGNVGHALVEALMRATAGDGTAGAPSAPMTADPLFWGSVGWAAVPPILLMMAVHGLPTLARMLGVDESDTLLKGVVWGVVTAAFGWSAFGIYTFTVAVGVPAAVAWVAPVAIDLSVFGATRGLVKTAPLAARLKVHESQTVSHEPERVNLVHEPETVTHEPETANQVREPEPIEPTNQDREPRTEPLPSVREPKSVIRVREPKAVELPDPSAEQLAVAEALVESGKTKLDAEVAAIVIAARASGVTQDDTAAATGVPVSTVKRTTTAARALEAGALTLTAVG